MTHCIASEEVPRGKCEMPDGTPLVWCKGSKESLEDIDSILRAAGKLFRFLVYLTAREEEIED
jgi:hypothetical protein